MHRSDRPFSNHGAQKLKIPLILNKTGYLMTATVGLSEGFQNHTKQRLRSFICDLNSTSKSYQETFNHCNRITELYHYHFRYTTLARERREEENRGKQSNPGKGPDFQLLAQMFYFGLAVKADPLVYFWVDKCFFVYHIFQAIS
jgi:hypothetical protein